MTNHAKGTIIMTQSNCKLSQTTVLANHDLGSLASGAYPFPIKPTPTIYSFIDFCAL